MKEQTLVEMKNKVDAITRVLQQLIYEQDNMRTLSVGMMETIKLMPGYDEAIKQVTEKAMEQEKENAPKLEV
jgi:coenzyme F420-reducing hydrogenase delta subunit